MSTSLNGSKPLSTSDRWVIAAIGIFAIAVVVLMRMDTSAWAFQYQDYFVEIDQTAPEPKLDFEVRQIAPGTVALELGLENIKLVEFCSKDDLNSAVGHVHIFVNGRKYGSFHVLQAVIENLSVGVHSISVSLNQPPSHKVVSFKGKPVSMTKTITVKE